MTVVDIGGTSTDELTSGGFGSREGIDNEAVIRLKRDAVNAITSTRGTRRSLASVVVNEVVSAALEAYDRTEGHQLVFVSSANVATFIDRLTADHDAAQPILTALTSVVNEITDEKIELSCGDNRMLTIGRLAA